MDYTISHLMHPDARVSDAPRAEVTEAHAWGGVVVVSRDGVLRVTSAS